MDRKTQELRRAWIASGSLEAEVSYLAARLGADDVTLEALALAAWLGHPAACAMVDQPPFDVREEPLEERLGATKSFVGGGRRLAVRLATALSALDHPTDAPSTPCSELLEGWILEPSKALKKEARQLSHQAWAQHRTGWIGYRFCHPVCAEALWVIGAGGNGTAWSALRRIGRDPRWMPRYRLAQAWAAIHVQVVPWVLGESDPVRVRVEARNHAAA